MNKRYDIFLSLAIIIAVGAAVDAFLFNDKHEQDEKIIMALAKKNFTNIKVFGRYKGEGCDFFEIKRFFQAEHDGKIAYGSACTSEKDSNTVVKVESLGEKPDPSKLLN